MARGSIFGFSIAVLVQDFVETRASCLFVDGRAECLGTGSSIGTIGKGCGSSGSGRISPESGGMAAEFLTVEVQEKGLCNESEIGGGVFVVSNFAFHFEDGVESSGEDCSFDAFHETGTVGHGSDALVEGFVTDGCVVFLRHSSNGTGSRGVYRNMDG